VINNLLFAPMGVTSGSLRIGKRIADQTAGMLHRLAISDGGFFEVFPGPGEQARRCESLIGQNESRGSR
jgi:hypothetical protein